MPAALAALQRPAIRRRPRQDPRAIAARQWGGGGVCGGCALMTRVLSVPHISDSRPESLS